MVKISATDNEYILIKG